MHPSSVSARSMLTALCLLSALGLAGCSKSWRLAVRPPIVPCEAGPAALIPPIPADPREQAAWVRTVLSLYEGEVEKRSAVRRCLQTLRDEGVIR